MHFLLVVLTIVKIFYFEILGLANHSWKFSVITRSVFSSERYVYFHHFTQFSFLKFSLAFGNVPASLGHLFSRLLVILFSSHFRPMSLSSVSICF